MKIGLEIHIYVNSKSKLFCQCPNSPIETEPNTLICEICSGQPGAKPMNTNKKVVESAIITARALGCKLSDEVDVLHKHYFYPDLPTNFQRTSQPIGIDGKFLVIGIREVHFEEDAGRFDPRTGEVDFNRAGCPLLEIVTEPDIKNPEEAFKFVKELTELLEWLNVVRHESPFKSDCNISISGGERVEIKNVGTLNGIKTALEFEAKRQSEQIKDGKKIIMETRHFDETKGITIASREKETEADYRYLVYPDILTLNITEIAKNVSQPKDLYEMRKEIEKSGVDKETARAITLDSELAKVFSGLSKKIEPRFLANWLRKDLSGELNYRTTSFAESGLTEKDIGNLLFALQKGEITEKQAKEFLRNALDKKKAIIIVKTEKPDEKEIRATIERVIRENEDVVQKYKSGKKEVFNFLLGQVSKALNNRIGTAELAQYIAKMLK